MTDHKLVYRRQAQNYQRLIAREDYQENLLPALREIGDLTGLDMIDLGSGTGRLACLLAPLGKTMIAFDLFPHMLNVAVSKLKEQGSKNWLAAACDHRHVPLVGDHADLVVSGWSLCYLVVWEEKNWQVSLESGLNEINRILREEGMVVIIETLGTGVESPEPPEKLLEYFQYLEHKGFHRSWLRTDYRFQDREEAVELVQFFFGEDMLKRIVYEPQPVLPECTGIWWKRKPGK